MCVVVFCIVQPCFQPLSLNIHDESFDVATWSYFTVLHVVFSEVTKRVSKLKKNKMFISNPSVPRFLNFCFLLTVLPLG